MNLRQTAEFFFFNDTATTEIYTLSLHDALPISRRPPADRSRDRAGRRDQAADSERSATPRHRDVTARSEEHTSELQSRQYLVCRLLLEKKNTYPYDRKQLLHHKSHPTPLISRKN